MNKAVITMNQDKPKYPSVQILGPSKEEVKRIKNAGDSVLSKEL